MASGVGWRHSGRKRFFVEQILFRFSQPRFTHLEQPHRTLEVTTRKEPEMTKVAKVATALLVVIGMVMGGMAVAAAVEESGDGNPSPTSAVQEVLEALDPLVENGTLTSEQAEAVADQLAPHLVRARLQDRGEEIVKHLRRLAGEIAEVLGLRPDELGEYLADGMTLAQVAEVEGWTGSELVIRVTDHIAAHLSVQVTAGRLDAERADEIVGNVAEILHELVDIEHPFATFVEELRDRLLDEALASA
jgi:hypothetical protein